MIIDFFNRNRESIYKYLFVAGTLVFIYLTVNYLFGYIAPFAVGLVFSLMLEPLANFMTKKLKAGRAVAALVCIIAFTIIIGMLFSIFISQLIGQGRAFVDYAISFINSLPDILGGLHSNYSDIMSFLPEDFEIALGDLFSGVLTGAASALGSLLRNNTGNIASVLASFLLGLLISLVSTFFFIKDKFIISDFLSENIPKRIKESYDAVRHGLAGAFLGYMKSQLFLMAPTAVICTTGLFIIKYPFALFVGLLIAVFDVLPIFGAGMILGPWAILSFVTGNISTGIILIVMYVIIVITRQVLEPRIIGRQIGLHPLITLMSIYIGLRIFGLFGFLIGPMTVVIIKALIYGKPQKTKIEREQTDD